MTIYTNAIGGDHQGPTFIVAAANSLHPGRADYVCDGVDDQVQIQAAIDALPSGGGKVLCMEGNYSVKNTITLGDNTTVEFIPGNTVTIPSDQTLTVYTHVGDSISTAITNADHGGGNDHVSIIGMNIDFNGDNGKTITQTWAGMWLNNCNESIIRDCIVYDVVYGVNRSVARAYGILFTACTHSKIIDCEGSHCGYEGIGIRGLNSDIFVVGCYGFDNYSHVAQASAWLGTTDDPHDVVFDRCWGGNNDIILHGTNGGTQLYNSTIQNCNVIYISVKGTVTNAVMRGNHVASYIHVSEINDGEIENILVDGNTIYRPSGNPESILIQSGGSTGHLENIVISNNQIYNGRIEVNALSGGDISGIQISGNSIITSTTSPAIELAIASTGSIFDIDISNNMFQGYTQSNLLNVNIDGDGDVKYVSVGNNTIADCARMVKVTRTSGAGVAEEFLLNGNIVHIQNTFFQTIGAYTNKVWISNNWIIGGNFFTDGTINDIRMTDNRLGMGTIFNASLTNAVYRNNSGYHTENSGTDTVVAASTSKAVTHGLSVTPAAGDIMVTPMESLGNASFFWVDTYTSTQFTIRTNAAPGADTDFAWKAIVL